MRTGALAITVIGLGVFAPPAQAVHLFPLTPVFDPLGHDCAKALSESAAESGGQVSVAGFSFVDGATGTATTTVQAGEPVSWTWLADHCHSVTFEDGTGTLGGLGFLPPDEPEMVRKGEGDSFTMSFEQPGTYKYLCVHHKRVGMQGAVIVE